MNEHVEAHNVASPPQSTKIDFIIQCILDFLGSFFSLSIQYPDNPTRQQKKDVKELVRYTFTVFVSSLLPLAFLLEWFFSLNLMNTAIYFS